MTITKLSSTTYASKTSDCEILILTQMPTDKKFEEIAILNATTDTDSVTKKDFNLMLPSLKAKACELGANAIVIKNMDQGGQWVDPGGKSAAQSPTKAFCIAILISNPK
jgi:hypothetical protein